MAPWHRLSAAPQWVGWGLVLMWIVSVGATAQAQTPSPVGPEFQVNSTTANIQRNPAMAMDAAGNFVITWADVSGQDGDLWGIFAQRYQADGTALGTEFLVNTTTAGSQLYASIAMDTAGNFVITWSDASGQDGDLWGIFAQRYQADGTPAGAEFQVNTNANGNQQFSTVAMDAAGNFVIAWTDSSGHDGNNAGIFAQRYQADGTPAGTEFQVNTTTTGAQIASTVAMDTAGNFVIAWTDNSGLDGDIAGIFAQRYQADGTPAGTEFQVNTTTTGAQLFTSVAMDTAGNFVIAWTDFGDQDGDGGGIFAQRYQADGTPAGTEFQVNTTTTDDQLAPSVAMDTAGNFVIAWTDISGLDGGSEGVFAQSYQADGTPAGTEFQVNTTTGGDQQTKIDPRSPLIAMDGLGHLAIAWTDLSGIDSSSEGVFAQRFQMPDITPPRCQIMAINHGPPSDIIVETQDLYSGIASINVVTLINATVEIPQGSESFFNQGDTVIFAPPTTALTVVRAEQIDPTIEARLELEVTDASGNVARCDPIVAELEIPAGRLWVHETFVDIPMAEHFVTIQNSDPGLRLVVLRVNRQQSHLLRLQPGEVRTLDVAADMVDGPNTFTVLGFGQEGARALVTIADMVPTDLNGATQIHWQPSWQRGQRALWKRR